MKKLLLATLTGCLLTAGAAAHAEDKPYCREYTQTFTIAGKTQKGYGTACLQPDGSWQIISQKDDAKAEAHEAEADQPDMHYVVKEQRVYIVPVVHRHTRIHSVVMWDDYPPRHRRWDGGIHFHGRW